MANQRRTAQHQGQVKIVGDLQAHSSPLIRSRHSTPHLLTVQGETQLGSVRFREMALTPCQINPSMAAQEGRLSVRAIQIVVDLQAHR